MKRVVRMLVVLFIGYFICVGFGKVMNKIDSIVFQTGYIQKVEDNELTIVDLNRNVWLYEMEEGDSFKELDRVEIVFDNQNTRDVKDDVILKLRVDKW